MPVTPEFKNAYKKLNPEQKKAVDTIEGPVMVIAGPGTGKTQILALRIANILLKTDVGPDSILALTFTESGVFSMRKRLVNVIGSSAHKINIFTFHGFSNEIIRNYPEEFPRIIGARNASEIDQVRIMEEILSAVSLEYLKPYGDMFYYLRPVLGMIRNLKREDIDPKEFDRIVKKQAEDFKNIDDLYHEKGAYKGKMKGEYADLQKKIEKNKELALLFKKYEEALKKHKLYDYEDMIIEVVKSLKSNKDLLLRLQERYQYILADEHQDANRSQNEILELLSNFHDNPNIFIVGDEKQAIFRFQGASLENFLHFKKLYPKAAVISLTQNYRSTQPVLDAAASVIENNKVGDESLRKKLIAAARKSAPGKIFIREFSTPEHETLFVVRDIKKRIESGVKPDDIAVIYRENKDSAGLIRAFEKEGVRYTLQSDQNVFDDEDIAKLIKLFRAIAGLGDNELLVHVLYLDFLDIEPLNVYKLIHCANEKHIKLFDAFRSAECLADAEVENPDHMLETAKKLSSWATVARNKNLLETAEIIFRESGFLAHLLNRPDSVDKLAKLENIFAEMKRMTENDPASTLENFIAYVDVLKKYNIAIKTDPVGDRSDCVRLMTAHRSKGLEFEYVYIVGAYDGHWGNKREIRHFHIPLKGFQSIGIDPLEDERRLFYVALTRAKSMVSLSFPKTGPNGESVLPSQFLSEFKPELVETVDTEPFEKELGRGVLDGSNMPQAKPVRQKDKDFLRHVFLEQGMSVTALNKYLSCPWDYFFNNLLRIPSAETKHQLYGTAIHRTLRDFFNAYKNDEDMPKKKTLALFERYLADTALGPIDFEESFEKGTTALTGYIDAYADSWPRNLITEYSISGIGLEIDVGEKKEKIFLRGVLDKLEILSMDGVNVVDYKTARPKTRNAVMGLTKTESGDYYRQLVFYKLLLDESYKHKKKGGRKFVMQSGEIDFIEPDERGKYHKEKFVIPDEEVAKLKDLIRETARKIHNLDFWDEKCEEKDCSWCALRDLIV